MKILDCKNFEELSSEGACIVFDLIVKNPSANICLATGGSPKNVYELLVKKINEAKIDVSQLTFTKLDEWYDVSPDAPFTCETFIQENILQKLHMQPKQFISFQSDALDIEKETVRVQALLEQNPIDLMILGLGMNGHLGLNEPNDTLQLPCHYAPLNEQTKRHDMVDGIKVEGGLTLGMSAIFDAKQILFLVSGSRKEAAYEKLMSKQISTQTPASFLWLHQNCTALIDKEQFR